MHLTSNGRSPGKGVWAMLSGVALFVLFAACGGCADTGDAAAGVALYDATQATAFDSDEIEDYLSIWDDSPFE